MNQKPQDEKTTAGKVVVERLVRRLWVGQRIKISDEGKKQRIRQLKKTSQTGTITAVLLGNRIRVLCDNTKQSITYHESFWEDENA